MSGYLKITRLSIKTGTHGIEQSDYQVNFTISGSSYVIAYDEDELIRFLKHKVALAEEEINLVMADLQATGHVTIGDVDMAEEEASAMGMKQNPEDF